MSTLAQTLASGNIVVLPTDTLYGICGLARNPKTVERIYAIRERDAKKPFIVLISDFSDLKKFGVVLTPTMRKQLKNMWPGKVSVVLPVKSNKLAYLHRGTKTIAFRWPKKKALERLIADVGPLVAPSANPEGKPPATTIARAKRYFGSRVDHYQSGGTLTGKPSTLIKFEKSKIVVLREGAVKL